MSFNDYVNIQYPSDGLVGFEVKDQTGATTIIRTIATGTTVSYNQPDFISSAYLSDSGGNQITSIPIQSSGTMPEILVTVTNNQGSQQSVIATFNLFDSNGVPIALGSQQMTIGSQSSNTALIPFQIPSWAHYGTAYAFVNVYNNWPSQGGVPQGVEKTFQFTITGGAAFPGTAPTTNNLNGIYHYYNFTYRLPKNCALGTYTAYSSANYQNTPGAKSTTFQVAQLGDLNADGAVNFKDISLFVSYYVNFYTQHTYTQSIDYNNDGKINFNDIQLFVKNYIFYWSP
jgi:hypothetical protein